MTQEAVYMCQECGEAPATTKRRTPLFDNVEVCAPCAADIDRARENERWETDPGHIAHWDAIDALKRAGQPAGALTRQLALALSNARVADWSQSEITALAEALRTALIADWIIGAQRYAPGSKDVDFATAAVLAAEPWIQQALDPDAFLARLSGSVHGEQATR